VRDGAAAAAHAGGSGASVAIENVADAGLPAPPAAADGRTYFAQSYDVAPQRLAELETWFATTGRARFGDVAGLDSVDTYADLDRPGAMLTTVLAFRDEAALRTFLAAPASTDLWSELDALVGPHGHRATDRPPVYRAPSLSLDASD
jgi:hypothetical protein